LRGLVRSIRLIFQAAVGDKRKLANLMKRLYVLTLVLTLNWRFVFGAVKRDWLLILALQTTFNVHYFCLNSIKINIFLV
jgi:hypothetical protein